MQSKNTAEIEQKSTGKIYLITGPTGKRYIGQTTGSFKKRVQYHKSAAALGHGGCRLLMRAMAKHGVENFKFKVIAYDLSLMYLDLWEKQCIIAFETLAPKGYNLMEGGNSNKRHSEVTIKLMREVALKRPPVPKRKIESQGLPVYLSHMKSGNREGYKILGHPKCDWKIFCNPRKTMEEKLKEAKDFLEYLNKPETPVYKAPHLEPDLPKYISRLKEGYSVEYRVNGKRIQKAFTAKAMTMEEKRTAAFAFYNQIYSKQPCSSETETALGSI